MVEKRNNRIYQNTLEKELSRTKESNIQTIQEVTRGYLAKRLVAIFGISIVLAFSLGFATPIVWKDNEDNGAYREYMKDLISVLIAAQTGLVSTALGFYFGSRSQETNE